MLDSVFNVFVSFLGKKLLRLSLGGNDKPAIRSFVKIVQTTRFPQKLTCNCKN